MPDKPDIEKTAARGNLTHEAELLSRFGIDELKPHLPEPHQLASRVKHVQESVPEEVKVQGILDRLAGGIRGASLPSPISDDLIRSEDKPSSSPVSGPKRITNELSGLFSRVDKAENRESKSKDSPELNSPRRAGRKKLAALIVASLILPGIAWVFLHPYFQSRFHSIVVTGTIEAKEIPISSKVTGRISKVMVEEGEIVKAGQPLIELDTPELEARRLQCLSAIRRTEAHLRELLNGPRKTEIDSARAAAAQAFLNWQMLRKGYRTEEISKAKAQRNEAERELSLLESGYRDEEVEQARAVMEEKKVQLEWSEKDWQRYQTLAAQGAVSGREAEEVKTKMDAARNAFRAAEKNFHKFRSGPRADEIIAARERLRFAKGHETMISLGPRQEEVDIAQQQYLQSKAAVDLMEQGTRYEEVEQARARLLEAQGMLAELDAQLKETQIVSPSEAEVSVMDLHAGQVITANKPLAKLTRLDKLWTRVYIPEHELSRVRVGQIVELKTDAYPDTAFAGTIVQIPSIAEFTPRNIQTPEERASEVFALKINVDNADRMLRGGMNAEVVLPPTRQFWDKVKRAN